MKLPKIQETTEVSGDEILVGGRKNFLSLEGDKSESLFRVGEEEAEGVEFRGVFQARKALGDVKRSCGKSAIGKCISPLKRSCEFPQTGETRQKRELIAKDEVPPQRRRIREDRVDKPSGSNHVSILRARCITHS